MKEISIDDIKNMLTRLLDKKISREEASNWAFNLRNLGDNNELIYKPIEFEKKIWDCILFIEGIDLRDSPEEYLYNETDIIICLKNI